MLSTSFGDVSTTLNYTKIAYDHLPWIHQVEESLIRVHRIDARVTAQRVGYVMGAGDRVPEAIRSLGVEVQQIDPMNISSEELRSFDAVVFGIRALNTIDGIDAALDRFYTYTEEGGTLIMQYNTSHRLKTERIGPAGKHISLSRLRVTEEDAEVVMGTHRALQTPNRLSSEDFAHWVQERGLYFPSEWPSDYAAPLSMHDAGEDPLQGSLLILDCGKGSFVYTGLSFFRELPAGVPGAYRLWANLLSL